MLKFICIFFLMLSIVPNVHAQGMMVFDDNNESIISGTITNISNDQIMILVNDGKIKVDIEDLEYDDPIGNFLKVGDQIQAIGKFDDNEFEANKIIMSESKVDPIILAK